VKEWLSAHLVYIRIFLILLVLGAAYAKGHHDGAESGAVAVAKQSAKTAGEAAKRADQTVVAINAARTKEQSWADKFAAADSNHQEDMRRAQASYDRTVADLRAGNLRLRSQWRCPISAPAGADQGRSGGADDWQASAGRIVRAADQCDAQVRRLQDKLKAERQ